MKGQGSVMQVMVGVLVVSVLLLFLFVIRANTTQESISAVGRSSQTFRSGLLLSNIDSMTIKTHTGNKMELGEALSYTCSYSSANTPDFIDNSNIRDMLKTYLDNYLGSENYVLEIENCFISIGSIDSTGEERRIGTEYVINLANGETARMILYI